MKTSTTLGLLLTGSLILNAYFAFINKPTANCPSYPGFSPIDTIPASLARTFAEEYKDGLVKPDDIAGGYITRTAFEDMLSLKDCNGIYYSLARDSAGKTGPGNNGVFLVLTPVNLKLNSNGEAGEVRELNTFYYKPRPWCPPNCILIK